jgi:hypothetical protein
LRLWLVAFAMTVGVVILLSIASDFREILTRHRRGRHRLRPLGGRALLVRDF